MQQAEGAAAGDAHGEDLVGPRIGEAVARALGFEPGEFQRQYAELVRAGIDRALESNAVAQVLDKYFEERISPWNWQGTAGQLYDLLNKRLGETKYLGGDEYSIADIATYPWVARHDWHQVELADFPNVKRWFDTIGARPAVVRASRPPSVQEDLTLSLNSPAGTVEAPARIAAT